MDEDIIKIPREKFTKAKIYYGSNLFYGLSNCISHGSRALFMPELVDARIASPKRSMVWRHWYVSSSTAVSGKTKQGNTVLIYCHVPNEFINPKNFIYSSKHGFSWDSAQTPAEEFQRLLDLEDGKNVFVVDYKVPVPASQRSASPITIMSVSEALKHPHTVPFLGGRERTEAYLDKHKNFFGKGIEIHYPPHDDAFDLLRTHWLFLGDKLNLGILGALEAQSSARFLGVQDNVNLCVQKISPPSLEQIMKVSSKYIAPADINEAEKEIGALYK